MGRTSGSGYRSQMCILLVLQRFGRLYGEEIVKKTGVRREEVWRNLEVLLRKQIIKKEKLGRVTYYSIIVNERTLEYIIMILAAGGLRNVQRTVANMKKEDSRLGEILHAKATEAKKVEDEIIELGDTPYFDTLKVAKDLKEAKKQGRELNILPSSKQTKGQREAARQLLKTPDKPLTKEITLPSGQKITIRKATSLEAIDWDRKLQAIDLERQMRRLEKTPESDPDLVEAKKRLLS